MTRKLAPCGRSHTATLVNRSPRVHCAGSAADVNADLTALTGVLEVHADPATAEVRVTYRVDLIGPAAIRAVLAATSPTPNHELRSLPPETPGVDEAAGVPEPDESLVVRGRSRRTDHGPELPVAVPWPDSRVPARRFRDRGSLGRHGRVRGSRSRCWPTPVRDSSQANPCRWRSCPPILGASGAAHALLGEEAPGDTERDGGPMRGPGHALRAAALQVSDRPGQCRETLRLADHGSGPMPSPQSSAVFAFSRSEPNRPARSRRHQSGVTETANPA